RILLDHGALISEKDNLGRTALHWAALNKHKDIVEELVREENMTALHLAAEGGEYKIIKPLVAKGALVDALDRLRETLLHYTARNMMSAAAKELLDAGIEDSIMDITGCISRDLANKPRSIDVRRVIEGGNVPLYARNIRHAIEE
ncbi:ankyrin, partial [Zopfia rhizophila CBS 207.26]